MNELYLCHVMTPFQPKLRVDIGEHPETSFRHIVVLRSSATTIKFLVSLNEKILSAFVLAASAEIIMHGTIAVGLLCECVRHF